MLAIRNHETQRSQWKGIEINLMSRYPTIPAAYTKASIRKDLEKNSISK